MLFPTDFFILWHGKKKGSAKEETERTQRI